MQTPMTVMIAASSFNGNTLTFGLMNKLKPYGSKNFMNLKSLAKINKFLLNPDSGLTIL